MALSVFYFSCKSNKTAENKDQTKGADTTKFFQLSQYFKSEIAAVNKTPFFIYKIDIINNKRDSTAITTSIFNHISSQFYKPDINDPQLKKYYKENIFFDETTKTFTISYSTENKELEIQNIDVLLQEDGETVKRIFIRKYYNYTDSSALEQLSWKTGESFQINRAIQKADNKEDTYQTMVVWDEKS